jgi:hypothetical protein
MFINRLDGFKRLYSLGRYRDYEALSGLLESLESIGIDSLFELKYRIKSLILESKSDAFSNDTHNKISVIGNEAKRFGLAINIDYSFDAKLIITIEDSINEKIA